MIFSRFALPKVLKRMGLKEEECVISEAGLEAVVEKYADTTGIRDLGAGCRAYCGECTVSDRSRPCKVSNL